jgi:chromosome segregation ATPase
MGSDSDKKAINFNQIAKKYVPSILSVIIVVLLIAYLQNDASISQDNEKNILFAKEKLEKQLSMVERQNRQYKDEISSSSKSHSAAQTRISQLESELTNERSTASNLLNDLTNTQKERDQLRFSLEESVNGTVLLQNRVSQLESEVAKEQESCRQKSASDGAEKENLQKLNDEMSKKLRTIENTMHLLNTTLHSVKHAEANKGFWDHVQDLVDRII